MSAAVRYRRMQGLSLVEVMVSLVIGLVVVGAVLVSYFAAGVTGRQQAAYAEINENAQLALTLIARDLLLAGSATPTGVAAGGLSFTRTYAGRPVFGCRTGFETPAIKGDVACAASGSDALEVVYQADAANSVPTSGNKPTDCLGNGLVADAAGVFLAYNRYYLASSSSSGRSELHCASRQGAGGQPLVDNVEGMTLWYGEANAASPRVVVRYLRADAVSDWGRVISVRVCLLMRSSEAVLGSAEDTLTYLDCDSEQQTAADGYVRRAYFSTTTLRNKMAF